MEDQVDKLLSAVKECLDPEKAELRLQKATTPKEVKYEMHVAKLTMGVVEVLNKIG